MKPAYTKIFGTRFWRVDFPNGDRAAAVVDDFGNLVFVSLRVRT
jgi:hypothetical protein